MAMDMDKGVEEEGVQPLPAKPDFGALSAKDQHGNKVEFRRVGGGPRASVGLAPAATSRSMRHGRQPMGFTPAHAHNMFLPPLFGRTQAQPCATA